MQPMQENPVKTTTSDVVQIGDVKMVVKDVGKGLMVFGKSVNLRHQKLVMADDHESSSSSTDKYSQPRWCPPGLTHTQKRRLQRMRRQEQKEQEAERLRDEQFNKYMPIIPQDKVWRVKTADHPARPIKLVADSSDRSRQGPTHVRPLRQEYRVNEKKEEAQLMQVDPVKTTTSDVVEIGDVKVVVKDFGKGPMVFGK